MSDTHHLDELCSFLDTVCFEDLPRSLRQHACLVVADTLAVIAAGSIEPEVRSLTARRQTSTSGRASIIGAGSRTSAEQAAFLNGTAGTFLELDEGSQFALGHPGVHVLPAALAAAEVNRSSGRELLLAVVLGYEVAARIGIGATIRPSMHPHGTWGTVGSAVAVAKLGGADTEQLRTVINIASTLGLGTSRETMYQGGTVRNSFAGFSGSIGLTVWDLLQAGFCGERDGLATVWGSVLSTAWEPNALTDSLGSRWEIARNYFKLHACCRYNHAALDALARITEQRQVEVDDISAITVTTYALAAALRDPAPKNTLAGKFSLPFALSTTLVHGHSGVESFSWDALGDERAQALARLVTVHEDPSLTAMMPARRPARVTLHLNDGCELQGYTETNRGDSEDPYSQDDLRNKFFALSSRVWPRKVCETLHDHVMNLDQLPDINALTRPLDAVIGRQSNQG